MNQPTTFTTASHIYYECPECKGLYKTEWEAKDCGITCRNWEQYDG